MLRRIKAFEELKKTIREDMLNIQLLAVRSPLHSSSLSSKCAKGKIYNEKIKLPQMIIDRTKTRYEAKKRIPTKERHADEE